MNIGVCLSERTESSGQKWRDGGPRGNQIHSYFSNQFSQFPSVLPVYLILV